MALIDVSLCMDAEPKPAPVRARPVKRRRWWRLVVGVILVLGAGLWGVRVWLGERAAAVMREQLAVRGIHVSWESAALTPGLGLAFEGFKLHRDREKTQSLLAWDQVTLRRGADGWTRATVQAHGSSLVMGEGKERLEVTDLNMNLHVDREGLHLEEWTGKVHGLRLDVVGKLSFLKVQALRKGDVAMAQAPVTNEARERGLEGADLSFLAMLGDWLKVRALGKVEPRLKVRVVERETGLGYRFRAELDGRDLMWRGQRFPALAITADWELTGKPEPILFTRLTTAPEVPGQQLRMVVDTVRQQVDVRAKLAVLHPLPVLLAAVPSLAESLHGVTLEAPVHLRAEGVVSWAKPESTRLAGAFSTNGKLGLMLDEKRQVTLERPQMEFAWQDRGLLLKQVQAGLWGGQLAVQEARLRTQDDSNWSVAGLTLQGAQIPELRRSLAMEEGQVGRLDATWQGGGGFALASIQGQGRVKVTDALFYRLPLLGPLHLIFDKIAPGFAKDTASRLELNHTLKGERLEISGLKLQSAITEIQADGTLDLASEQAKLTARAQLRGIAGLPTLLLGRLLTLDGQGPFANIQWRLRYAPGLEKLSGVAGLMTGTAGKVGGTVGGAVIGVGGAGVGAAAGAVKGAGKAAKGILTLPGRLLKKK